jgi:hypothetical protein
MTKPVSRTIAARGLKPGDYQRFVVGHYQRSASRYPMRAGERVHRSRAEAALGRPLRRGEEVHHASGIKTDALGPLVICQGRSYHFLLHARMRIRAAGGNPNTEKICSHCQVVKPRSEFNRNRVAHDGLSASCRICTRAANAEHRRAHS